MLLGLCHAGSVKTAIAIIPDSLSPGNHQEGNHRPFICSQLFAQRRRYHSYDRRSSRNLAGVPARRLTKGLKSILSAVRLGRSSVNSTKTASTRDLGPRRASPDA